MTDAAVRLVLKKGREKAARLRHPWLFSGSIDTVEGPSEPGELADLYDAEGEFQARGFINPRSQILFRALSWRKEEIGPEFFRRRLESAQALRRGVLSKAVTGYRVVHGEGDGLPGFVADRFGETLVVQFGAAGMDRLREPLVAALNEVFLPVGIWERSEGPARREEGLEARNGPVCGAEPAERVVIEEDGARFVVDVRKGHKTGFYLDQRPARRLARELAPGRRVLDVFACTGAFAVSALLGDAASVTAVDSSEPSLRLLPEHLAANGRSPDAVSVVVGDAFRYLRACSDEFDLIIVDPPPFARKKSDVEAAARGYKDINMQAMKRLAPGGLLLTSSCSHHVDPWLFQQILFGAARDAGRAVQLLTRSGQPPDHPVSIHHPEGEYLKVFLLRAMA